MGGNKDDSAKKAAKAQQAMLQQQIAEQRAAYGDAQGLFQPYQEAGFGGLNSYLNLLGQNGNDAQQQAISGIEQTPGYQAQLDAGQRTILQNASATGGLRGGNVQQGLAEFGSGLFGNYYQNMLGQLGALQQQGMNVQTNLANARMGVGGNVGNAYSAMGDAQAQGILGGQGGGFGGMASGALSGAASGAMMGSVVPGIGTMAGAIGGGALGALGGK